MKIYELDLSGLGLTLSSADLYTLANANTLVSLNPASDVISSIAAVLADGQTILTKAIGGTSIPPKAVQPAYYPKAVKGAECAAHLTRLDWANENLEAGYQYVPTGVGFFVAGVLNSTQTQANDPFDNPDIIGPAGNKQVACWEDPYSVTINPFA